MVAEGVSTQLRCNAGGLAGSAQDEGWWVESESGHARIQQDTSDRRLATLTGQRAGLVKVVALVGTQGAERIVRVTPRKRPTLVGLSLKVRSDELRSLPSGAQLEAAFHHLHPPPP